MKHILFFHGICSLSNINGLASPLYDLQNSTINILDMAFSCNSNFCRFFGTSMWIRQAFYSPSSFLHLKQVCELPANNTPFLWFSPSTNQHSQVFVRYLGDEQLL
ncbi:uncharacterized protein AKAW2_40553A [Aspergillus luchuensis]|uniref:Uncharacterized protein n=1 Tax=Aspergillus kawachii TaxID=1069201 RepID=A0A7R7ZY82_ASPKA|nr:uncharacterized protein AKAW2_40553A [Aspergillus luchuensis]BCR98870.1 hypothetical protein AKAW2_40553A [Aspergillus luchuensis]